LNYQHVIYEYFNSHEHYENGKEYVSLRFHMFAGGWRGLEGAAWSLELIFSPAANFIRIPRCKYQLVSAESPSGHVELRQRNYVGGTSHFYSYPILEYRPYFIVSSGKHSLKQRTNKFGE
jgi:hypothetical protein